MIRDRYNPVFRQLKSARNSNHFVEKFLQFLGDVKLQGQKYNKTHLKIQYQDHGEWWVYICEKIWGNLGNLEYFKKNIWPQKVVIFLLPINEWLSITAVKIWGIFIVENNKILYYSLTVEKLDRHVTLIANI